MTKRYKLYDVGINHTQDLKNTGHVYKNKIFRNLVSSYIFRNSFIAGFLEIFENAVYEFYILPKRIVTHFDYTKKKDSENFR